MFAGSFMVTVSLQFDDFITCPWKETINFEKLAIFIILLHTFLSLRSRNRETRSAKAKKRKTFFFLLILMYVCMQVRNQDFMWGGAKEAKVDQTTEMDF